MKLIQSLDISEGISMDSLKPIINSGSEATFDSCLGMKDAVMDDNLLHSEKRSQISQQKDKSLTDIGVESIGNNAKKMFENVDLNSSDLSLKRDSWNSGADYDKSSEKENMGETNEGRFDFISDDESESIHLKMSSDDDNSLGEADIQKTNSSNDVQNSNMSENINLTENVETNSDKAKTCSNNNDIDSTERNTKVVDENSVEESVNNTSFFSHLDEKICHDTLDVSSADGFECIPSCSKEIPLVSGINSPKNQNEVINEISDEEQEIDITSDEKSCFNLTKNESENALMPTRDSKSVKMPDDSEEELCIINDDNLNKRISNKNFHFVNSEIDKGDSCALRTKRQSESDDNSSTGVEVIDDSSLGKAITDREINDSKPLPNNSSADGVSGNEKSTDEVMSRNLCDQISDEENKVIQHQNDEFKLDESKARCSETDVLQTLQKSCNNAESNNQLLDESEGNYLQQEIKADCNVESRPVNAPSFSNSESSEEHMDCSDSKDSNTNDKLSVITDKTLENTELDFPANKDFAKFRDVLDSTEDNECKQLNDPSNERKTQLHSNKNEVPSSRKRTSPNADEKTGFSSKRSKVAGSDSDDSDVTLVDNKSCEQLNKNIFNSTKDDEVEKNELSPSKDKVNSDEVETSTGNTFERMNVGESVDKKEVLGNSESDSKPKKEVESGQTVKVNPLPFLRNFNRAQLQTMTRNDLEELVLQKICEAITERSVCGELREIAVSLDQKLKGWQKKSFQLSKQVKDLSVVVKRYGSELHNKGPNVVPMKITRSVGLQVQMPGSSSAHWNQDESWRKGEKVQSTTPTSMTTTKPTANSSTKTTPSSPGVKLPPSSPVTQKIVENTNSKVNAQSPVIQNTQSASTGLKVLQTKSPTSATPPSSSSKTSQKQIISSVNNRLKTASDLQVIDLTDVEDKLKSGNSLTTTNALSTETTSTVVTSINNTPITSVGCRSIRVVQHLSSTSASPLLTPTVTTAVAGQRVAYYVPTTTVQPRQLIISNPPVRPSGVVVSHRPSSIPAIVLKPGPIVPVSAVAASNANIIRTSNVSNALQVVSARPQPRTAHYLHRSMPVSASPLQSTTVPALQSPQHPAPLPPVPTSGPNNTNWKLPPPKPDLKISKVPNRNQQGIVLSWNMTVSSEYEEIASYQLFAYQEGNAPPSTQLWKKVGDVKALPLPMACTLTQFMEGHKYHFAVRAVDVYARYGPFSSPGNIVLTRN